MKCEQCQVRPANIQVRLRINNHFQQLHLCQNCYQNIQGKLKSPSAMNGFDHAFGYPSMDDFFSGFMSGVAGGDDAGVPPERTGQGGNGLLDNLGRNLSHAAKAGLIDPVIGRDEEVTRVIETLNRRNKNNPVLIGEPGVGKTAIAEGLALKIAEGKVPKKLQNKELYLLDVASLVADTGIRGQFEQRMKQLFAELQERNNVILFVDEIHLLVGAGKAEGSMDAGNILKPALARGEIQMIGATTLKEYRDMEKDAALERRFQPIIVHEPTLEEAVDILKGLAPRYEEYHQVSFPEETIRACVHLSHRYIQDRFLPDKAIDLMDEAGSRMNLLHSEEEPANIEERLQHIRMEKEKATENEQYERAAELRDEEQQLQKQLEEAASAPKNDWKDHKPVVQVEDIQRLIEQKTGVPVRKIQEDEQAKLKDFAERLAKKVIGQEEAVQKVAKAIRRSRAGLKAKNRPVASFLFVGPTGVGKTELAKRLAEELFGDKEAMIRLDMSEYMEKHAVSKLIGSPPGYVGHDEAGQLTEKVRRNPYSIVLLDEIEKAHPDVQHIFLQIMEDGRLTDSQGRTVSFKDTVIIMTSNAGTMEQHKAIGFAKDQTGAREANLLSSLGQYFKPEFLNRFDNIIPFKHLQEEHLVQIVDLMLAEVHSNLAEQNVSLTVTDKAKRKLAEIGYHPSFGARPLRRTIQEHVEDGIADVLLDDGDVRKVVVDVQDEQIVVRKAL